MNDPLPFFKKSRVVIPVVDFSLLSHRCRHPTPWRSRVGDPDGSSRKIGPTVEKNPLEAVWKQKKSAELARLGTTTQTTKTNTG